MARTILYTRNMMGGWVIITSVYYIAYYHKIGTLSVEIDKDTYCQ